MVFTAFLFGARRLPARGRARNAGPGARAPATALLALAVMTKGPVALVLVGLFFVAAWLAGADMRAAAARGCAGRPAAAGSRSPPRRGSSGWTGGSARRSSRATCSRAISGTSRSRTSFSGRAISHTFYARVFAGAFFPWSAIVVGRGVDLLRGRRDGAAARTPKRSCSGSGRWSSSASSAWRDSSSITTSSRRRRRAACSRRTPGIARPREPTRRHGASRDLSVLAIAAMLIVGGSFSSVYLFELNLELPTTALALPIALLAGRDRADDAGGPADTGARPATAIVPAVTLLAAYLVVVVRRLSRARAHAGERVHRPRGCAT